MILSVDQVSALAPDGASLAAGTKLATGGAWKSVARDSRALWGECQGSALYQVRIDLSDLTAKCSCPSRKFPCKHALGLLLMAARKPADIPEATAPVWVDEWLQRRGEAAQKKEHKTEAAAAPPIDDAAQLRRAQKRADRVAEGLEGLDLWIADLIRNGLGTIADRAGELWESQAARMVDAQAPGIASRLRRLSAHPRNTSAWARRVLVELGQITLLIEAFRRTETLDVALREDVRALIGWTLKDDEVTARGTAIDDRWWLIGQHNEDDGRLRAQRTWMLGLSSGRYALVLQFAAGAAAFPETLVPGTVLEARLRYWPSAYPMRALIETRGGSPETWSGPTPGFARLDDMLIEASSALAAQPWLDRLPCVIRSVRPARTSTDDWHLVDDGGRALPLAVADHSKLLALSGGNPIAVAGEWDGDALFPLAAVVDGQYERLT